MTLKIKLLCSATETTRWSDTNNTQLDTTASPCWTEMRECINSPHVLIYVPWLPQKSAWSHVFHKVKQIRAVKSDCQDNLVPDDF